MTATGEVNERQARQVAEEAREAQWCQPSFGKELFLGRLRLDLVHPYPRGPAETTERGEAFSAKLRAFCETQIDAAVIERERADPGPGDPGLEGTAARSMKISPNTTGSACLRCTTTRHSPWSAPVHPALGALLSAHQSIGTSAGVDVRDSRAETHLAALVHAGDQRVPADRTGCRQRPGPPGIATATPDGDDYLLDGVKLWTTNGVIADLLVVMAQVPASDGHRGGITAFVVEADTPGIAVTNRNAFMGLRGIENGLTKLTDVRVPADEPHRPRGEGLKIALTTLNVDVCRCPAVRTGTAKWSLEDRQGMVEGTRAGGRPVGSRHDAVARQGWRSSRLPPTAIEVDGRASPANWPTRAAPTSGSRPRSPSSTAPRWRG